MTDYCLSSANKAAGKRASEALTNKMHHEFSEVFLGIDCVEGTFSLHIRHALEG